MPPFSEVTIHDYHRLWAKTSRTETCWLWTGCSKAAYHGTYGEQDDPYGYFGLRGRSYLVHRVAYFLETKVDPGELMVLHTCNNTICVNPAHLEAGDQFDNMQHMVASGRNARGWLAGFSVLSEEDIPEIRRRSLAGEGPTSIGRSLGVSPACIDHILRGDTWGHVK